MIKEKIKTNNFLGRIYLLIASIGYYILSMLIPVDKKLMLFCSFSGRKFNDSPRVIYNEIIRDNSFANYKLIWVINNPNIAPSVKSVKMGSLKYYWSLFRARYWVSNASIERLIPLKTKKHIYINTWHGIPLKRLGIDQAHLGFIVENWYQKVSFSVLTCCSEYDAKIFKHIFPNTANIQIVNLPRNLPLLKKDLFKEDIFKKLGIIHDRKIILYAPTFRDYSDNKLPKMVIDLLDDLSKKYVVLVRAHYFSQLSFPSNVIDVSKYSDVNELMIISDALITDYSSILFDYAILTKPIFLFVYDLEKYLQYRGFYKCPLSLSLPYSLDKDSLENLLRNMDNYNYKPIKQINSKYQQDNTSVAYIKNFIKKDDFSRN